MNLFRILGDILHLFSFIILILKIRSQRSCEGTNLFLQLTHFLCDPLVVSLDRLRNVSSGTEVVRNLFENAATLLARFRHSLPRSPMEYSTLHSIFSLFGYLQNYLHRRHSYDRKHFPGFSLSHSRFT